MAPVDPKRTSDATDEPEDKRRKIAEEEDEIEVRKKQKIKNAEKSNKNA